MEFTIVRHAQTLGNQRHAYVGSTDEPLCEEGLLAASLSGIRSDTALVHVSPLSRATETAAIKFPNARQVVCPDFREMDFGEFEGRSADEMSDSESYRQWVSSGCYDSCPGGESLDEFASRIAAEFERVVADCAARGDESLTIVAHGGTIMAIMSRFSEPPLPYFSWRCANCGGYRGRIYIENGKPVIRHYEEVSPYGK